MTARHIALPPPLQIGIVLFPDVEVLDFAGPFEVFSVACRVAQRDGDTSTVPLIVSTVAAHRQPVRARHGLTVMPHHDIDTAPSFDLLIIPSGIMDHPLSDSATMTYSLTLHMPVQMQPSPRRYAQVPSYWHAWDCLTGAALQLTGKILPTCAAHIPKRAWSKTYRMVMKVT